MAISKRERHFIEENHPSLRFITDSKILGSISVHHVYNDFPVSEYFDIEILIANDYPESIPIIKEIGGKIPDSYEHRYSDGRLCLGTDSDILTKCNGRISIDKLIKHCVISFLFSFRYFERFGEYPFGDRSHGGRGIVEAFMELFGVANIEQVSGIIKHAVLRKYRGHLPCPCGSGKTTRQCHPISTAILQKITYTKYLKAFIKSDLKLLQEELKLYERDRKKAKRK